MMSLTIVINLTSLSKIGVITLDESEHNAKPNENNSVFKEVNPSRLQYLPVPYVDCSSSGSFNAWFTRLAAVSQLANWTESVQIRILMLPLGGDRYFSSTY